MKEKESRLLEDEEITKHELPDGDFDITGLLQAQDTKSVKARDKEWVEVVEDLVFQFGHRGVKNNKPMIWTGGLSALEGAFEALGWEDPHYLPEEGYTCEVKGCMEADTAGTHWGDSKLYLRLCHKHNAQSYSGKPMPEIKQSALDREATRDPITRCLPMNDEP